MPMPQEQQKPLLRCFFIASFFIGVNLPVFLVFTPVFLPVLGHPELQLVSVIMGIPTIVEIFSQNYWGWLCMQKDRFKFLTIVSFLGFFLLYATLASFPSIWLLILVIICHGILGPAVLICARTAITLLHPGKKGRILGRLFALQSLGWGSSSLLCGAVLQYFSPSAQTYRFLFGAFSVLNLCLIFYLLRSMPSSLSVSTDSFGKKPKFSDYKNTLLIPAVFITLLVTIITSCGSGLFFVYFGRYLESVISGTHFQMGLSMALATFFGAMCYPILGKLVDSNGGGQAIVIGAALYTLTFFSMAFIENPWLFVFAYAIPVYPMISLGANSLMSDSTDESQRSIGFGMIDTSFRVGRTFSPALGALIFAKLPLNHLPIISTAVVAIGLMVSIPLLKKNNQVTTESLTK
jgi:predicted MFS family arabinose efflux permease